MDDLILQAKQVAKLVGGAVDENVVKQWTFGRPYTITPSVRSGKGAGQANLYSLDDVFLFAVAAEMHTSGIAPEKVRLALSQLHNDRGVKGRRSTKPSLLFLHGGQVEFEYADTQTAQTRKNWTSYYVLNLDRLRGEVEQAVKVLSMPFKSLLQADRENKK
jgi:hypothetical protein